MGTTLAIIGAYILANELAAHDDYADAFKAYEDKFRPFAEKSQELPPGVPKIAYAGSDLKVRLIHLGAAIGASKPIQKIISMFSSDQPKQNTFDLPEYSDPRPVVARQKAA